MKKLFCLCLSISIFINIQSQQILPVKDLLGKCNKHNSAPRAVLNQEQTRFMAEYTISVSVKFDEQVLCLTGTMKTRNSVVHITDQGDPVSSTLLNRQSSRVYLVKTRMPQLEDRLIGSISMPFIKLAIGL